MCPQLRHHESAKIRLEAQRQTQVNVSSVSFGEHRREETETLSDCDFEGSQPAEERADRSQLVAGSGHKKLAARNYKKDLILS